MARSRRRRTLRRRLTFAFACVALAAVGLTTWMTLGAVFEAQNELFEFGRSGAPHQESFGDGLAAATRDGIRDEPWAWGPPWRAGDPSLPPAAAAFRRIARTALFAALLSVGMAVVAAGLFTRVLTQPLLALTHGAQRLASGERGIQLPVPTPRDELRDLSEAFNSLVAGLERQEAWRRDMTADIAHDLRTPLAVLRSEIEGMQDGVIVRDEAALARLHGEVMLLTRLVDDLRTLAVTEGGGLTLRREKVEVEPLLRRSVDGFRARAAAAGATLTLRPIADGLTTQVDPDRIGQVVGNLLDNALRYAGPVPIEVQANHDVAGGVRITVRDRGPGLPEEALERVFERFYRSDPARTRTPVRTAAGTATGGDGRPEDVQTDERADPRGEAGGGEAVGRATEDVTMHGDASERRGGSGLGLSIARAIVEAHGGRLKVANDPAGGAVFTVHLPA